MDLTTQVGIDIFCFQVVSVFRETENRALIFRSVVMIFDSVVTRFSGKNTQRLTRDNTVNFLQ